MRMSKNGTLETIKNNTIGCNLQLVSATECLKLLMWMEKLNKKLN